MNKKNINNNSDPLQSGIQDNSSNSNNGLRTPLYVQKETSETGNTISLNQMKQQNFQLVTHNDHTNESSETIFTPTSSSNNLEQTKIDNNKQELLNVENSINFVTQTNNLSLKTNQNQIKFTLSSDNFTEKQISENENLANLGEDKKNELDNTKTKKIPDNKNSTKPKSDPLLKKILRGCLLKLFKYFGCLLFIISITIIIILYIINF